MNSEDIYCGMSEIEDRFLTDALDAPRRKRRTATWLSAAACLVLVGASLFLAAPLFRQVPAPSGLPENSAAIIPRWEEQPLYRQYGQMDWNGEEYYAACPIDEDAVGQALGMATATGYDVYEEKDYALSCTVYELKDISPAAGVAVQYEGHEEFYSFRASLYTSGTLGDLIDDLSLEKHLEIGLAYYDDAFRNPGRAASYRLSDTTAVWDLLLGDRTLKNEGFEHYTMSTMGLSVSVKVLGISNLSLAVNEDGYLQTNFISTGASYFIGKEKAQAFMDYVFTHGEAVDWPPAHVDDTGEPETGFDASQSATAPSRPPATPY